MTTVADSHAALPVTDADPTAGEPGVPRPRRRRVVWAAVGVAVISVGAGAWLWVSYPSTEATPVGSGPVATAAVERGTISATESWDGTIDYGAPFTIKSTTQGTVTRLVDQGAVVELGAELYRVDERPVTLFYGAVPMYRDLGPDTSGADVAQLEANLAELGYTGFTGDDTFDAATADAVRAWQATTGAQPTGTVARSDVVFVPAAGRVDTLRVDIGDLVGPGSAILDLTGTDEVVSIQVDVDDRDLVGVGTEVTVVLPAGDEVAGTVSASTVVEVAAEQASPGGDQTETEARTAVQITLAEDVGDDLVGAAVEVVVALEDRTDVLLVPVNALLALSEGGYGLEVVGDDGTTDIVVVDTGLFADGKVQVDGDGIVEGTVVGMAGR